MWETTFDLNILLGTDIDAIKKEWKKSRWGKDYNGKLFEQLKTITEGDYPRECTYASHIKHPYNICYRNQSKYKHYYSPGAIEILYSQQKKAANANWPKKIVSLETLAKWNDGVGGARKKKQRNTRRNRNNRCQSQSKKNQKKSRQSRRQSQSKKNQKKN